MDEGKVASLGAALARGLQTFNIGPTLSYLAQESLFYGGAALIVYGCYLAYRPAAFMVAGVLLLAGGILTARAQALESEAAAERRKVRVPPLRVDPPLPTRPPGEMPLY